MLDGLKNVGLQGRLCLLLSMGKLGRANWEIIPEVVLYRGSLERRLPVIPLCLILDFQLDKYDLSLKYRVILEGHGITLLSVKILR